MVGVKFPAVNSPIVKIDSPAHSLHVGEDVSVTLWIDDNISESGGDVGALGGENYKLLMG